MKKRPRGMAPLKKICEHHLCEQKVFGFWFSPHPSDRIIKFLIDAKGIVVESR